MNSTSFNSFFSCDWDDFYNNIISGIETEIGKCDDDYILNVNEDEYISYLIEKYALEPLTVIKETEEVATPTEFREDLSQYRDDYLCARYGKYRQGYSIRISYSYNGTGVLFKVRPNRFASITYQISLDEYSSRVSFIIKIYSQDPKEFEREKEDAYRHAFTNIDNINSCVASYNNSLNNLIRKMFLSIKQKRLEKTNFFAAIKVNKTTNTPSTYGVPVIKKTEPVKPSCPNAKLYSPEPSLDMSTYENISSEINSLGASMERKPSLYLGKDEEGLRDTFVTLLETRFKGITATGETFNHCGKTDILLKNSTDGSNLFIAECKFWHGPSLFQQAISQLFDRYLTWRDSKTALMVFVNGTGFTKVLNSIKENIVSHPYYVRPNKAHSDTSTNYIFSLPQDKNKEVFLEVMVFNFDKNKEM